MKKIHLSLLMMLGMSMMTASVNAQDTEYTTIRGKVLNYNPHKYQYIGLQGGIENTFANYYDMRREPAKTWTPTMSLSYGGFWSRILGARLHFNGIWNKTGIACAGDNPAIFHKYNYITPNADLLVNLCNANKNHEVYPINVMLVAGLGSEIAWETTGRAEATAKQPNARFKNSDNDIRAALNARLGLLFDIPLSKHWSVNLETDLNYIETFTDKVFNKDNLQFVAQLGINYRFGYKKSKPVGNPVTSTNSYNPANDDESRIAAANRKKQAEADELARAEAAKKEAEKIATEKKESVAAVQKAETVKPQTNNTATQVKTESAESVNETLFYEIRMTNPDSKSESILNKIADWSKKNPSKAITIEGYADKGTGNAEINRKYALQRAQNVANALIKRGVAKNNIKVESHGDTVQPFNDNDRNRCVIIGEK